MSNTVFVILSFEGPDGYSRAGGLGVRASDLSQALASLGLETHLFFIGDPNLAGHEVQENGKLHLHRWSQWISRYHPNGVYDGEEGKLWDWNRSLPGWLETNILEPTIAGGGQVVILAEEWHTAESVIALNDIRLRRGWHGKARLLWNANNTFSFHRIDWNRLSTAAIITTVSKYMKHVMWRQGVNPRVIPNGINRRWLTPLDQRETVQLTKLFRDRVTLVKVARWDPDKRWDMAIDATAELKKRGLRPLLLARGGMEDHGREVLARTAQRGLDVAFVRWMGGDLEALVEAIRPALAADMVVLNSHLTEEQRRPLFRAADAVLANSGLEPFGLVGLETMAVGGVAFVGATGEDYVTLGHDAISVQTSDPLEIVHHILRLRVNKESEFRLRQAGRQSAARYVWQAVIRRVLFPVLEELGIHVEPQVVSEGVLIPFPTVSAGGPEETHIFLVADHRKRLSNTGSATVVRPIRPIIATQESEPDLGASEAMAVART
jgi:glycosyltransferase involved in cell wall biosynthesis